MAGIGFDAFLVRNIREKEKVRFGTLGYLPALVQYFFRYTFRPIYISIDSHRLKRRGYLVVVGNTPYYGGKIELASEADMTDGYLDISIFRHKNWISLLHYLYCLWRRKTEVVTSREYFQAKSVEVHQSGKQPVYIDAEPFGTTPVTISVCPSLLSIACKN